MSTCVFDESRFKPFLVSIFSTHCLHLRRSRQKAIAELEKQLTKSSKNDTYFDAFRQTATAARASMRLVETYQLHQVLALMSWNIPCWQRLLTQGDSRDLNFVSKCMTTAEGERVKAQLILSDPPGKLVHLCCSNIISFNNFRQHRFEARQQQQNPWERCFHWWGLWNVGWGDGGECRRSCSHHRLDAWPSWTCEWQKGKMQTIDVWDVEESSWRYNLDQHYEGLK